jgi:putative transposase
MEVSTSGFYEWLNPRSSNRFEENQILKAEIGRVYELSRGAYGRRRIAAAIANGSTAKASVNRIERKMKEMGLAGYVAPSFKRTTIPDPMMEDSPNLIKDCQAKDIDEIWVSDITYIRTAEGWLYLCTIMDLYSRNIVGWSTRSDMKVELVMEAFNMAHKRRNPKNKTIFHSDKGGQYKSRRFRRKLARLGYAQSMTGANHCFDNAAAESFFGTLKTELIRGCTFPSRESAESAIFEYIEVFYNRVRLHSSLGYLSPVEFEKIA